MKKKTIYDEKNSRKADYPIDKIFLDRWSPRAMSGKSVKIKELMSLFEAARWAPSSGNEQPWRFIYALRDTKEWGILFSFLDEGNRKWCVNASALIVTISRKTWKEDNSFNEAHSFDTGAAWENLALQGRIMDFVVHGMAGFDYERAKNELKVPDEYKVEMMIAVGHPAGKEVLSEYNKTREFPKGRNKVEDFVFEGKFNNYGNKK